MILYSNSFILTSTKTLLFFVCASQPTRHSNVGSTNDVSLGRDNLFAWAIPFSDARGPEMTFQFWYTSDKLEFKKVKISLAAVFFKWQFAKISKDNCNQLLTKMSVAMALWGADGRLCFRETGCNALSLHGIFTLIHSNECKQKE